MFPVSQPILGEYAVFSGAYSGAHSVLIQYLDC